MGPTPQAETTNLVARPITSEGARRTGRSPLAPLIAGGSLGAAHLANITRRKPSAAG